ncbi:unnamed protein product, partial [Coregonus sp. 'balchen']
MIITLCLIFPLLREMAGVQSSAMHLVSANIGDTVTLQCFHEGNLALHFLWFKQTLADNPQLMTTFYSYDNNATFHNEFEGNPHYLVQSDKGIKHLRISDMQLSDSAIIIVGVLILTRFRIQKHHRCTAVCLSQYCTIHTETCAGEHCVYWFRHGSGDSRPGIIYTHEDRSCVLNKNVIQPDPVMVTHLGQSVSLTCFCRSDLIKVSWFKQTVGRKPLLMASSIYPDKKNTYSNNFYKDFTENKRLSVKRGVDSCNLTISKIESGDSATYYCVSMLASDVTFGEGTVIFVKDSESNSMSVIQQPVSESVQPGDSVTLNCTIHTETCAGEHSVYWFRHGSGESHPGIIYTYGDRSDQCERSPEAGSPTQSCVYNLPKRNLSLSDAGTYYCAVASCGEILFGKGTKLDIENGCKEDHVLLVYCLGVALALCVILIIDQDADTLHYAALNVIHKKVNAGRQRSAMESDTVYSGQTVGQKPLLMPSYYGTENSFYYNNFTETKHLSVKRGVDSSNLTISKTVRGLSYILLW